MGYDVKIDRPALPALVELHVASSARGAIEAALGLELPDKATVAEAGEQWCYRLGPSQWLLRTTRESEREYLATLEEAAQGQHALICLMSDALALFEIKGRDAHAVLTQGIAIDLSAERFPAGSATRCGFAKTSAIVHCHSPGEHYELLADKAFERYVASALKAAAGEPIAL